MSEESKSYFTDSLGISRLMAFSDGVFSIAITLLVFQLQPPTSLEVFDQGVLQLLPKLMCYLVTFQLIGIYWIGHVSICRHLRRYNRPFLLLNIVFLMMIGLMPFPTAMLGSYPEKQISVLIYSFCFAATGIVLALVWHYATKEHRLVEQSLDKKIIKIGMQRILLAPIVAMVSILLSFISTKLSIVLFILVGVSYFLPSRIEKLDA